MTSDTFDDAQAFVEMMDAWLEAVTRLEDAASLLPRLEQVEPPAPLWERVGSAVVRSGELVARFDELGEAIFFAPTTPRRKLMLDICGTLRHRLVEQFVPCYAGYNEAVTNWQSAS